MADPEQLSERLRDPALPPVHSWHPAREGTIDIRIARDGTWYHEDAPIAREPLYRLFSRVLRRDLDGGYYLVTPAEKLRIQVDDAPFVAVAMETSGSGQGQQLTFVTNCGDRAPAGPAHPMRVAFGDGGEPAPYVLVRDRLEALLARPVYYATAALAEARDGRFGVWSGGVFFALDSAPAGS